MNIRPYINYLSPEGRHQATFYMAIYYNDETLASKAFSDLVKLMTSEFRFRLRQEHDGLEIAIVAHLSPFITSICGTRSNLHVLFNYLPQLLNYSEYVESYYALSDHNDTTRHPLTGLMIPRTLLIPIIEHLPNYSCN